MELKHSKNFHEDGVPLLVSPQLLRQRNLGQVDLAKLLKDKSGWILEVSEVKSSEVGVEGLARAQKMRLLRAAGFLSGLLGVQVKLSTLVG